MPNNFSIPDFASSPEDESEYMDSKEYKDKTRLTRSPVTLLAVFFERLLYVFIASKHLSLFNG